MTLSIAKAGLKTSIIQAFYNEIFTNASSYYYFLGKTLPWGSVDEALNPDTHIAYEQDTRNRIITLKKIQPTDVSYIIPRHNWISGTIYDIYDDFVDTLHPTHSGATSIENAIFYCITDEYNVYKCLWNNNNQPSTVKPYSTNYTTIETPDGYKWKYMYTVPVAYRNKFMTINDIPVTTAINSRYYTKGGITSTIVQKHGTGYTNDDQIVVQGDGYLEENPYKVTGISINSAGSGYTLTPNITFEDPFDSVLFANTTAYLLGQKLKTADRIYEVVVPGTSSSTAPTHTSSDIVYNGTVGLKFVGRTVTGTVTLTGDGVSAITLNAFVGGVTMVNRGYGYTSVPNIVLSGTGTGAVIVPNVVEKRIVGFTVSSQGSNYTLATVTIDPPMVPDSTWSAGASVAAEDIIYYTNKYYRAVNSGTLHATNPPIHSWGTVLNGTVQLEYVGENAVATVNLLYSYGYQRSPQATIDEPITGFDEWLPNTIYAVTDTIRYASQFYEVTAITTGNSGTTPPTHTSGSLIVGGLTLNHIAENALVNPSAERTRANIIPIVENGQIIKTVSLNAGVGYTTAAFDIISGTGSGAEIIPVLSVGDLDTKQANIELLAIPGTIDAIKVTNPGTGYVAAIIEVLGDGVGCQAVADIVGGQITNIRVTNPGSGYTRATVSITGNIGASGATARPIVSPSSGHGKNAVTELYAKDISLYTSIASDKNQGFTLNNDYRQLGILKNPLQFDSNYRFDSIIGSTCYLVNAQFNPAHVSPDDTMTSSAGYEFTVISKTSDSLLLQSLDKVTLQVGEVLTWGANSLVVESFATPTVNKYSGELLYIDNRNAFIPSAEQFVSIKTAIRF